MLSCLPMLSRFPLRRLLNVLRALAITCAAAFVAAITASSDDSHPRLRYDVVVYGGTSAGVIAAVEGAGNGKSVCVIEPTRHLGGMSSSGLGLTDAGSKGAIGGMSLEFYQRIYAMYHPDEFPGDYTRISPSGKLFPPYHTPP